MSQGAERLTEHSFDARVAKHLERGIESFYRPRSSLDGWSVNACRLDSTDGFELRISAFDGQNREANAAELAHLSKEPA